MDLIDNALKNFGEEAAYLGASHNKFEYSLNHVMTGQEEHGLGRKPDP